MLVNNKNSLKKWNILFISRSLSMWDHPGKLLAEQLEQLWYTQKAFSLLLGKKVSEINELIKGKRNITISWDILLSKMLWTPQKFWILKQIDYDYQQALESISTSSWTKKKPTSSLEAPFQVDIADQSEAQESLSHQGENEEKSENTHQSSFMTQVFESF